MNLTLKTIFSRSEFNRITVSMTPTQVTSCSGDIIEQSSISEKVYIDFLLPNGFMITLLFHRDSTLNEIRSKLYEQALKEFDLTLNTSDRYIFSSINEEAAYVEFYDYERKFSELKIFQETPFFKLVKDEGDVKEKLINLELSNACGINIEEIESVKDDEIIEYRRELHRIVERRLIEENRINSKKSNLAAFESIYAPNLEIDSSQLKLTNSNLPLSKSPSSNIALQNRITSINIKVVELSATHDMKQFFYEAPLDSTPSNIINEILRLKRNDSSGFDKVEQSIDRNNLVLNICGCNEIIYGDTNKIGSYKYIKKCLSTNKQPTFFINTKDKLRSDLVATNSLILLPTIQNIINSPNEKPINKYNHVFRNRKKMSLECEEYFSFYLSDLTYYPTSKEHDKIFIKASIYHGQEQVGQTIDSNILESEQIVGFHYLSFRRNIQFNIKISELHRCAKLCLSLNSITKKRKEILPIAWISINIFDHKSNIISGNKKIYLWPANTQKTFLNMCMSEVTGQNPDKSFSLLKTEFQKHYFYYPTTKEIINAYNRFSNNSQDDCLDMSLFSSEKASLEMILNKDSLAELTEQDKTFLWKHRYDCFKYPNSLPKLLQTVDWCNKKVIAEMYTLLNDWSDLKPHVAIELLNAAYFDIEVRRFAVKCLSKYMKDEDIQSYLLQLVQSIKSEPYYNNDLTHFLLKRALGSQRLGFDLYWNLKSEMKNSRYKFKFGIILEAYCRGIGVQLKSLVKQIEVIESLSSISAYVKKNKEDLSLITGSHLRDELETPQQQKTLSNFLHPTNKSYVIGSIEPDKCRILSSAKRPLYLKWLNTTNIATLFDDMDFDLIFKNGDDLRQDMLTIQILKLMNTIWNNEGLNLNMLLYDCISTGYNIGFIEVIKHSVTIFKIHTEGGLRSQFQADKYQLFKWITAQNPSQRELDLAIDNFTRSCAGFCVATFVLGIGDRHPDNIMINRQGKLFHIDFGHFLGHFKTKYGFKRERVPFVLPRDFTNVIARGRADPQNTSEFRRFRSLCADAFMIIRKYSHFLINLFTLMISSGMPELQSNDDVMYMRKQLRIDESDDEARKFFTNQFDNVIKNSYTTKIDWIFHAMNKNNRI